MLWKAHQDAMALVQSRQCFPPELRPFRFISHINFGRKMTRVIELTSPGASQCGYINILVKLRKVYVT